MKPEVKTKWLAALRSGEYKQGRYVLRTASDNFCCLGVLCDLAEKAGVVKATLRKDAYQYAGKKGFLPSEVVNWAGLDYDNPKVGDELLTELNDFENLSFDDIADYIEKYL